jgi:hypothetical protein
MPYQRIENILATEKKKGTAIKKLKIWKQHSK